MKKKRGNDEKEFPGVFHTYRRGSLHFNEISQSTEATYKIYYNGNPYVIELKYFTSGILEKY